MFLSCRVADRNGLSCKYACLPAGLFVCLCIISEQNQHPGTDVSAQIAGHHYQSINLSIDLPAHLPTHLPPRLPT